MAYKFNPFSGTLDYYEAGLVSDDAYGVGWNGVTDIAPSKNAVYDVINGLPGGHDAVTLSVGADTVLELSTQEIGLDDQDANKVLAGPTTGAADTPAFRALVADDIPDLSAVYAVALGADDNYVTDAEKINIGNLDTAAYEPTASFAAALGADDNYVTDAEKIVIGNTSGTNTGDNTVCTSGAATTAETLKTARTIGGVSFDGSANITVATATGGFTISGGDLALTANNITMTGSLAATGARVTKGWFTDIESTNDITIGGTALAAIYAAIAQTFYIGTTQVAINRASAALTLAGITLTTPDIGTPSAGVLTNCTGLPYSGLANGTDGNLITWDADGVIAVVATGNDGEVLTSNGAGAAPTFQAAGAADNLGNHIATQDIVSDTADTDSLGSTTKEWLNLYIGDAGKIYLGLGQDCSIHRSAANTLYLTATTTSLSGSLLVGGTISIGDATVSEAELEILDGCTASTTQLNYIGQATGTTGTVTTNLVFSTSPTLVTPDLGTPSAGVLTNCSGTAANLTAGAVTGITLASGTLTLAGADALTLTTTAATNVTLPTTGTLAVNDQTFYIGTTEVAINRASAALTLAGITLTTPDIGTPSAGVLTNCTGLPAAAVVAGSLVANMLASDHGTAATDMLVNVCYGTGDPPAANTTTEGALFVKYTA